MHLQISRPSCADASPSHTSSGGRLGEGGSSQARRRIILVRRIVRRLDRHSAKRGGGSFSVGGSFSEDGSLGVGGSPLCGIAMTLPYAFYAVNFPSLTTNSQLLLPAAVHDLPASALAAADSADLARRLELREILFNAPYRQAHFRRQTFTRYFRELTKQVQNLSHTFYHTFSHTLQDLLQHAQKL